MGPLPKPQGKGKPELGLLIGIGKPKAGESGAGEEDGGDDPKVMAFRGLREAFESGDDAAGAAAFETLLDACGYTMEEEEPEAEVPELPEV
jgi:hypothetical protein